MLKVKSLSKYYQDVCILDNISFQANNGDVLAFLGENGAGKTTTMQILTDFIYPTKGQIKYNQLDLSLNSKEIKKNIGYVPEGASLYADMTVYEFLKFISDVRKLNSYQEAIEKILSSCDLSQMVDSKIGFLSKGQKRRLLLAQALIHDPQFLILDEPTDGLDPNQKFQFREIIEKIKKNKTIIISTHNLEEVKSTCNRVILLADKKIRFNDTLEKFEAKSNIGDLDEVFKIYTSRNLKAEVRV